ncbi:HPr kinase/phosphatase [Bacillus thuringiensis serovar aizawai str. Hu4-2]|nr:HPr kinase/phosphatase [Bacillus thuringiensis serovar aizawai str. Hu4-2]
MRYANMHIVFFRVLYVLKLDIEIWKYKEAKAGITNEF